MAFALNINKVLKNNKGDMKMKHNEERLSFLQKLGAIESNPINAMQTSETIREILINVQAGKYKSIEDLKSTNFDIETIFAGDIVARNKLESMLQSWERKENFRRREER